MADALISGTAINTGQVACASAVAATQIVAANTSRIAITFSIPKGGSLWLGNSSASTSVSSTGYVLTNTAYPTFHTQAAIFGLASAGTGFANITYIEEVH